MRLLLVFLCSTVALCVVGCGEEGVAPDAGPGPDAFVPPIDAGTDDAGTDAGELDASVPPSPLAMSRDETRADLAVLDATLADIPMAMRALGGEFLETDITRARLDAIVGEKGLIGIAGIVGEKGSGTLSLPMPVAPLLVILRHVGAARASIDRVTSSWAAETDPAIVAVRDALTALASDLETLESELLARFRDLVTPTAGLGRTDDEHTDNRFFHLTPDGATYQVLLEAEAARPSGNVVFDCGPSLTDLTVSVHDAESGAELLAESGPTVGTALLPIALRPGEPTLLRVRVGPAAGSTMTSWSDCTITVIGHRYWRNPETSVDDATLSDATGSWDTHMRAIETELAGIESGGSADDREVARVMALVAAELSIETGMWRNGSSVIDGDDLQLLHHSLGEVLPAVISALLSSPQLAGSSWAGVRLALSTMRDTNDAAVLALGTPPGG